MRLSWSSAAVAVAALAIAGAIVAADRHDRDTRLVRAEEVTGGNADRGRALFIAKGCGGCHTLNGVPQATGLVGPPLDDLAARAVIAGRLENTPGNLTHWIAAPQSVAPGNAMPNLPMTGQDARDMAAFLYTRS